MLIATIHQKLVHYAPQALSVPARLMPFTLQKELLLGGMNTVFREALAEGDFEFLEQRYLRLSIKDLGLAWRISYANGKLVVENGMGDAEVTLSGDLNDLILVAARKVDPDTLFFQRRLCIEGDTELGLEVKNLLDNLDLTQLPRVFNQGLHALARFIAASEQAPIRAGYLAKQG